MRKPVMAGNWKMFKTPAETLETVRKLAPMVAAAAHADESLGLEDAERLAQGWPGHAELLHELALNKIPSQRWTANVAFFQLLLLAYNLVHWFKRLCLPEAQLRTTVETLRHQLLGLPANLINRSGKNVLVLPRQYHYQAEFLAAAARLAHLKPLKSKS